MNSLVLSTCFLATILTPLRGQNSGINAPGCGLSGGKRLIFNGTGASEVQFPWMVRLNVYYHSKPGFIYGCGGGIVTRRHVITAAHCVLKAGERASRVYILYSHNDIRRARYTRVKKIAVHPRYRGLQHDIAILQVKQPFYFSETVRPLCLPTDKMNLHNRDVIITGWGRIHHVGKQATNYLQYTTLEIVHDEVCQMVWPFRYKAKTMLCARNCDSSSCKGDSGGPLIAEFQRNRFVHVGVLSYGTVNNTHCMQEAHVYTRVEAYMPWIKRTIAKLTVYENFEPHHFAEGLDPSFIPYTFSSEDAAYEPPYLPVPL